MLSSEVQQKKVFALKMKNQVTFGHLLTIMAIFVIPFAIWIKNVEVRFTEHKQKIESVQSEQKDIQIQIKDIQKNQNENYVKILEKLRIIELKVENKKDRQ